MVCTVGSHQEEGRGFDPGGLCPSFPPQSKDLLHNRLIGDSKLSRSVSANGWWCLCVGPAVTWQLDPEHRMNWVGVDPFRETTVPCLKHSSLRCLLTYKLDLRQRNVFLETKITYVKALKGSFPQNLKLHPVLI